MRRGGTCRAAVSARAETRTCAPRLCSASPEGPVCPVCFVMCRQRMSTGRRSHAGEESGAASWSRAAQELQRSRRAAARKSLRGIGGRGSNSTSCPAIPRKPPLLECAEPLDLNQQSSKSAHEVGAFSSTPLPARSFSATSKLKILCAHKDNAGAQKLGNK
ncbi:hypothetical protein NDU88_002459 [Pleurodeles waltl]|uniref:Uncharacterized protein n=1 Tax=Pleurodeles waltl TaxID=8319 RepID=A0AAV7TKP7_PLEWA|nr:hypothetical protein NDU88_002459 [Pleurodeles waltl]